MFIIACDQSGNNFDASNPEKFHTRIL